MCSRVYVISLTKRMCLIPINYIYRLTCRFLSLADLGSVAVRLYQAGNHTM